MGSFRIVVEDGALDVEAVTEQVAQRQQAVDEEDVKRDREGSRHDQYDGAQSPGPERR